MQFSLYLTVQSVTKISSCIGWPTCGRRCKRASPVKEPTARATRNWSNWLKKTRCMSGTMATATRPTKLMTRTATDANPQTGNEGIEVKSSEGCINSLSRCVNNFQKCSLRTHVTDKFMVTSCEISFRWMQENTCDKSRLVQVVAWCRQATSHYLSQCWSRYVAIWRHHTIMS